MSWATLAGSGALVVHDDRLLFVRQRRHYGVHWEFPSGYCEAGETFEAAAAREVLEETAIAVEIGELVCTMSWEREHDRRRNLLAYFVATPLDPDAEPRAQTDEDIDDAQYLDPLPMLDEIHPLHRVLVERWWATRSSAFHVHADVDVLDDGSQSYSFRPIA